MNTKTLLPAVLFSFITATTAALAERITDFRSEVSLEPDSTLAVTEQIAVDFGKDKKHGIYRDLPLTYRVREGKNGMFITVDSVQCDAKAAQFDRERTPEQMRLRIGSPDKLISGKHKYTIKYHAYNAVGFFDGRPEVYWNATGSWPFPIDKASVTVSVPNHPRPTSYCSYRGPYGSNARANQALKGSNTVYAEAHNLKPQEGLTIAAQYPTGTASMPSSIQRVGWFIQSFTDLFTATKPAPGEWLAWLGFLCLGIFQTFFGRATGFSGSGGGGFSGGGAGGGGGGSW